ncbi:SRPBCC family protein [Pengzhenrongella sicca]|uniref:SRPBCC family protein n=1 Tax=Pengzhenrongella sicca TaxID=2819238 RepID=A0A8A4ZC29_9MICO|nr:SRPBCC family protein [Pengzhenrongella sicca]QTE28971.1 SRPBCC family protein [Pengzhenrongella sicca]
MARPRKPDKPEPSGPPDPSGPPLAHADPPRGVVEVSRTLPLPAREAWTLLADPRHHARWIPLTRVLVRGLPLAAGTLVTATSGPLVRLGAPGLPDRMRIDRFDPPTASAAGVAAFTKLGPVLRGTAEVRVAPLDDHSARATWVEDVYLAGPLPASLTRRLLSPALAAMVRLALWRAGREVARAA